MSGLDSRPPAYELARTQHYVLELDTRRRVLRLTRTREPFESNEALDATFVALIKALDPLPRRQHSLLIDQRQGPHRNDPEFEQALRPHRVTLVNGFRRVAVLVQTAVGMLQVQRHLRADNLVARVFDDEHAAKEYVEGPSR